MASKAKTDRRKTSIRKEQGGKSDPFNELLSEVRRVVPPYDDIDVQTTIVYKNESPRGNALRLIILASVGLLILIGLYGAITGDRELLFAVLRAVEVTMAAIVAGVLGKMASRLLTKRGAKEDEKNEDSG